MPNTIFHTAIEEENSANQLTELLRKHKTIDINARNGDGKTALTLAVETKQYETAFLLYRNGASIAQAFSTKIPEGVSDIFHHWFSPWIEAVMDLVAKTKPKEKFNRNQELFKLCKDLNAYFLTLENDENDRKVGCLRLFACIVYMYNKDMKPLLKTPAQQAAYLKTLCDLLILVARTNKTENWFDSENLLNFFHPDDNARYFFLEDLLSILRKSNDRTLFAALFRFYESCIFFEKGDSTRKEILIIWKSIILFFDFCSIPSNYEKLSSAVISSKEIATCLTQVREQCEVFFAKLAGDSSEDKAETTADAKQTTDNPSSQKAAQGSRKRRYGEVAGSAAQSFFRSVVPTPNKPAVAAAAQSKATEEKNSQAKTAKDYVRPPAPPLQTVSTSAFTPVRLQP